MEQRLIAASAALSTAHGRKYLVQLCKHFAHKIDVTYSDSEGTCRFSCGTASLAADDAALTISVSAATDHQLVETKAVIEDHLLRFAFREGVERLDWTARG